MSVFDINYLLNLNPIEFEILIQQLLTKMGFLAEGTKISGDGGIDVIAMNKEPIVGGKYVVQCKRYELGNNVGEPKVRELFGVLHAHNANKGILITTSDFTSQAAMFAKDKAIELINGDSIIMLLNKYLAGEDILINKNAANKISSLFESYLSFVVQDRGAMGGLMWTLSGNVWGIEKCNFDDALKLIEKMNNIRYAGFESWRLPTLHEFDRLKGELDKLCEEYAMESSEVLGHIGFRDIKNDYYWTSNTVPPNHTAVRAYNIISRDPFGFGNDKPIISRDDLCYVWPVRLVD